MKKIFFLIFILFSNISYGYIGPGMGGGILVTIAGLIFAILIALIGLIYYPLKIFIKKFKKIKK